MLNSVPIEVFVWSPISEPTLVEPVSMGVLAVQHHRHAGVVVLQVAVGGQGARGSPTRRRRRGPRKPSWYLLE